MTKVECGGWCLEVDVEATRRAYTTILAGDPETCGCVLCRNFAAARHLAYSVAVLDFYERLGISADREAETYEAGPAGPDGLRYYGGWHHFIGRVLVKGDGDFEAAPGYSMVFSDSRSCAEPVFQTESAVVLAEFFTRVPWVLDEPPPGD
jgi:hypothetical protein